MANNAPPEYWKWDPSRRDHYHAEWRAGMAIACDETLPASKTQKEMKLTDSREMGVHVGKRVKVAMLSHLLFRALQA